MNVVWEPTAIESKSMRIIGELLNRCPHEGAERDIVKRVVHTTGDPGIVDRIKFHPEATRIGLEALRKGSDIFTDVNMLRVGVNSKALQQLGGKIHCAIADPAVADAAQRWEITRAAAAMRLYGKRLDGSLVAIGNAPTALFEVLDLVDKGVARPVLIVGTPVGFVGASESKELLSGQGEIPYITVEGTRGGSPVAAAIVNALLYYRQ